MNKYDVIKGPWITEKSSNSQASNNQYFFEVDTRASKNLIKSAVESVFKVKVEKICTMNVLGRKKRVGRSQGLTSDRKKAMVTLAEGAKIDLLEGK